MTFFPGDADGVRRLGRRLCPHAANPRVATWRCPAENAGGVHQLARAADARMAVTWDRFLCRDVAGDRGATRRAGDGHDGAPRQSCSNARLIGSAGPIRFAASPARSARRLVCEAPGRYVSGCVLPEERRGGPLQVRDRTPPRRGEPAREVADLLRHVNAFGEMNTQSVGVSAPGALL